MGPISRKAIDSLKSPSILREMDQRRLQGNRPVCTIVTKSKASTARDLQDKPSKKIQAQDNPTLLAPTFFVFREWQDF